MDEILFRLSTQLESLQVQSFVLVQHGQQWAATLMIQAQQYFQELFTGHSFQYIKSTIERLLIFVQNCWDHLLHQYHTMQFGASGLYYQVINACTNELSRREAVFCLGGLTAGTLFGYYLGINWKINVRHVRHIKALMCHHFIGIEGVSLAEDVEMPIIQKSDEIIVEVKAASVNVIDTKICNGYSKGYRHLLNSGRYKDLPVILGRECAGVVTDIGQSVINFDIGDKVFLAVPSWASGTMAEYIVVPENQAVKRPENFSFEVAASVPYNGCIAWDALVNKSVIKEGNARGKRVLIYGGVTPVGCIITQLVKIWGGYVLTICRQQAISVSKALGADDAISLGDSDLDKELQLHDKFDAIFYTGGPPIDKWILQKHLAPYGSYVSTVPEHLISDSLGFITGSLFASYVRIKLLIQYMFGLKVSQWKDGSKLNVQYLQSLSDLVDTNQFQIVVDRVYAPHNIEQALRHVLDPDAIGSTIITFQ